MIEYLSDFGTYMTVIFVNLSYVFYFQKIYIQI